jgi:hypothetical protein
VFCIVSMVSIAFKRMNEETRLPEIMRLTAEDERWGNLLVYVQGKHWVPHCIHKFFIAEMFLFWDK